MADRRQEFRSLAVLESDLPERMEHGLLSMQDGSEQEVAHREARALEVLARVAGVPRLVARAPAGDALPS